MVHYFHYIHVFRIFHLYYGLKLSVSQHSVHVFKTLVWTFGYCNGLTSDAQTQFNNIMPNFGTNRPNTLGNSALSITGACTGLAGFICGLGVLTLMAMGAITFPNFNIDKSGSMSLSSSVYIVTICMLLITLQVKK